jgi:NAD(P)H-hydrate epimerase
MRVLTAEQMRAADAAAVVRTGDVALMRAAGDALADAIRLMSPAARKLVAFAGPGNNGGDSYAAFAAFAASAAVAALHAPCECVIYAMPAPSASAGRQDAETRAHASGTITRAFPASYDEALAALAGADLVLDALLGTGARAELSPQLVPVVDAINDSLTPTLAVDIPTGVDATTGAAAEHAVRADATVMLGAPKLGLLLEPARARAGVLYVGNIGIDTEIAALPPPHYAALDDAEFLALLPRRGEESDKRSSGAPLVIAGSEQFPGAAVLCTLGAARAGAGYVTLASGSREAAAALRTHLIEQVVVTYDERDSLRAVAMLLELTGRSNAVAIGPGLGLSDELGAIVRGFLEKLERPFVADASALFHLGKHLDILRGKTCVLTPHAGEFARLSGGGTIAPGTRIERLRSFVARTGITTLLKGNATLIDDGTTMHVNVTGTNALATAGTGDVLSGIIATLLSQGLAPVDAARAGAYWHGLAGRHAAAARRVGVIASDVAESLGAALPVSTRLGSPRATRLTRLS